MIKRIIDELDSRDLKKGLADFPDYNLLKDISKAANRIVRAIKNKELIVGFFDKDFDGNTCNAISVDFFKKVGNPILSYDYSRTVDGYGMNDTFATTIECDLVITGDLGITNNKQVDILNSRNIDVIINDHHSPSKLGVPNAYAVVDTHQEDCKFPYKDISGGQTMFFMLVAVNNLLNRPVNMMDYLDIVGASVVIDMMKVDSFNRPFVNKGLEVFKQRKKPFTEVMMDKDFSWNPLTSTDLGFTFGPKINSCYRMNSDITAHNFLTAETYEEALKYYHEITELNNRRKSITEDIVRDLVVDDSDKVIIHYSSEIPPGIAGLIASRITNKYNKPSLVLIKKNDILKGSGRSPDGVNLFKVLSEYQDILYVGGHKNALGVTNLKLVNLPELKNRLNRDIDLSHISTKSSYLMELSLVNIDTKLVEAVQSGEPYGRGNAPLIFKTTERVKYVSPLGKSGYLKVSFNNINLLVFEKGLNIVANQDLTFTYTIQDKNTILLVSLL
jgi:single-stranded-DNA-specific exonuclease